MTSNTSGKKGGHHGAEVVALARGSSGLVRSADGKRRLSYLCWSVTIVTANFSAYCASCSRSRASLLLTSERTRRIHPRSSLLPVQRWSLTPRKRWKSYPTRKTKRVRSPPSPTGRSLLPSRGIHACLHLGPCWSDGMEDMPVASRSSMPASATGAGPIHARPSLSERSRDHLDIA